MALATLSIDIEARLAKLEEGMDKAGRLAEKNAKQIGDAYSKLGNITKFVGAQIAAAFAGFSVVSFIKSNAEAIDALNDVADATGSTIENISALEQVALRTGGSIETVQTTLIKFNAALKEAKPDSPIALALKAIGLNAGELRKMDPADALRAVAKALAGYADDGNKARLEQELLGKSMRELAPFLKDLAEKGDLQAKITTKQAEEAEKFNQQLDLLKTNSVNYARSITSEIIPALSKWIEDTEKAGGVWQKMLANAGFDNLSRQRKELENLNLSITSTAGKLDEFVQASQREPQNDSFKERIAFYRAELQRLQTQATAASEALKTAANGVKPLDVPAASGAANPPAVRPSVGDLASAPDKSALAAYDALLKRIQDRLAAGQQELKLGRELRESEKFAIATESDIAAAKDKLGPKQQAKLRALLSETTATMELTEAQQKLLKWITESRDEDQRSLDAAYQKVAAYQDQARALGLETEEVGLSREGLRKLEISRLRDKAAILEQRAAALDSSPAHEQMVELWRSQAKALNDVADARAKLNAKEDQKFTDASGGFSKAIDEYLEKVRGVGPATQQAVGQSIDTLENDLVGSLKKSKLDVSQFVDEVISEFFRLQIVRPLMASILGGASGGGGFLQTGLTAAAKFLFSANGNAFGPSGAITAFADGGVVGSPTLFSYSGGTGVMGEAGEEGVLPLKRGRDGKLGVRASGGAGTSVVHQHYYNIEAGISRSEVMSSMQLLERRLEAKQTARLARLGLS